MKNTRPSATSSRVLSIALMMLLSASSARADIYLTISDGANSYNGGVPIALSTETAQTIHFEGFTISNLTAAMSTMPASGTASLGFNATVLNSSSSNSGSPLASAPGVLSGHLLFTEYTTGGFFGSGSFAGAKGSLSSALSVSSIGGPTGFSISNYAQYDPLSNGNVLNSNISQLTNLPFQAQVYGSSGDPKPGPNPTAIGSLAQTFDFRSISTDLAITAGGSVTIHGGGTITASDGMALPEPSSFIAFFTAIPCAVGLLGFARRVAGVSSRG